MPPKKKTSAPKKTKKWTRAQLEAKALPIRSDATNLPRSLSQLGANGPSFQQDVFDGVKHAGYKIGLDPG